MSEGNDCLKLTIEIIALEHKLDVYREIIHGLDAELEELHGIKPRGLRLDLASKDQP